MTYNEESLRNYVKRCFEEAFKAENRNYDKNSWSFEWVIIKNNKNVYQLYPIVQCKYQRVLKRVCYALQRNLYKSFGIQYEDTNDLRCSFCIDGQIDYNFTQAMFKTKSGNISLSVFDENTNPYENGKRGEAMVAYTLEKLLFNYWNLDAELYDMLSEDDERRHLPHFMSKDWTKFSKLYKNTFGEEIGSKYNIICSSALKRM